MYTLLQTISPVQGWRDALGNNRFAAGTNSVSQPSTAPPSTASARCRRRLVADKDNLFVKTLQDELTGRLAPLWCQRLELRMDPRERSYWELV